MHLFPFKVPAESLSTEPLFPAKQKSSPVPLLLMDYYPQCFSKNVSKAIKCGEQ